MKFSALNVDFDGPKSLIFYVQEKLHTRASKSSTREKVVVLLLLASFSWKRLLIGMGMLLIATSTSDELFSHIKISDFERPWTSKIRGFIDFCDFWLQRTLQEWTAMKWLTICEQELSRRHSRISWALAEISSNFKFWRIEATGCTASFAHLCICLSFLSGVITHMLMIQNKKSQLMLMICMTQVVSDYVQ